MTAAKTKSKVKKASAIVKEYDQDVDYNQDDGLEYVLYEVLGKSISQANKERFFNLVDGYKKVNKIQVITDKKDFYKFLNRKKHTLDDIEG